MTTEIRGIDFGPVWGASGVQNFFGQGYPYHNQWYFRLCPGFDFTGMTFVAKTMTTKPKAGNMPLDPRTLMPVAEKPDCVSVSRRAWLRGVALNAVGLTNPGAQELFARGEWQKRQEPFFLSFSPQGSKLSEKLDDTKRFVDIFSDYRLELTDRVGLQLNISCPNTGEASESDQAHVTEALVLLGELAQLDIPIVVKINVLLAPALAVRIGEHPGCDGLCVSNTLPWDALPGLGIDRVKLFGSDVSPLAKYGGGGASGEVLRSLALNYLRSLRGLGYYKHINVGGGILRARHVNELMLAGADSVFLGSIAFLRPWRVQRCIRRAYQLLG